MAAADSAGTLPNDWIETLRVETKGSFLRLIFSFRVGDSGRVQSLRAALGEQGVDWTSIVPSLRAEARLAEHAAELLRESDSPGGLTVHRWNFRDRRSTDPIPARARVRFTKHAEDVDLAIDRVELWLFGLGFGYVALEVSLASSELRRWLEMLHWARYLDSGRGPKLRVADVETTLEEVLRRVLTSLSPGDWWEVIDIPRTLRSYLCLSVSRVGHLGLAPVGRCAPELQRQLLYQICEQAPPHRLLHLPTGAGRGDYVRGDSFEYSDGVHFVASREGVAYVAIDRDMGEEFWGNTMVNHLRAPYFLHYLATQYQRHAIEGLRRAVESAERDQRISDEEWRKVKDHSARVRSAGFFVELARTNNHARFERLVRDMAQVDRLFDLTTRAVDDLVAMKIEGIEAEQSKRQLELAQRQKQLQDRWAWIGTMFAISSVFLAFMSMNLRGITTSEEEGLHFGVALSLTLAVSWLGRVIGLRMSGSDRWF
jgi:hypothetical protein